MRKPYKFSKKEKKKMKRMFFGPYKKKWRMKNGIVDNSAKTIGKRLNIDPIIIDPYLDKICKKHFNNLKHS